MPSEMRPLARALALRPSQMGAAAVLSRTIGPTELVALRTGVGTDAAERTTKRLLATTAVDHVVVVGIAGSTGPSARIGEVVVPEAVVDGASGTEYASAPLGGLSAGGRILTSDGIIKDRAELSGLHERGILALDMETAAVARVCNERCPWTAIRSISDRATDDLLDDTVMGLVDPDGSPDPVAVLKLLASRPQELPRLLRLARGARTAARAAASVAARAVTAT
jgi:adenosylhomocysteine nucleosidase